MPRTLFLVAVLAACGGGGEAGAGGIDTPSAPDAPSCVPTSCAALGFECGEPGDGCGAILACGSCAAPLTCGGAAPHVCGAQTLAIDEKTVAVSGVVTANGQVPDQSCTGDELRGQVFFYAEEGPASFTLPIPCGGAAEPFSWSGTIYPGVYRVAVMGTHSSLPPMTITVAAGLDVAADRGDLDFDVTNHRVAGTITENGVTPSCVAGSEAAQVLFQDETAGSLFAFPVVCPDAGATFTWSGNVSPGTYRVTLLGENASLPSSSHVLQAALVVEEDVLGLAYDVTTFPVAGTVTLNGQVPGQPASCRGDRGHVSLESTTDGTLAIPIPCAAAGAPFTFSAVSYAGSYVVGVTGGHSDLPNQTFRPGLVVDVGAPVDGIALDVTAHPFSGIVTVNGAAPAGCNGDLWGEVSAYEPTKGYSFSLDVPCADGPFAFAGVLYPGSYHVTVSINGGEPLELARALEVAAPAEGLALDVVAMEFPVAGAITVNGATPGGACVPPEGLGELHLDDLITDASVSLPIACDGSFAGAAPTGTYRVSATGVLDAIYFAPQSLVVSGPVAGAELDIPTRRVAGTVTLDGATPSCTAGALAGHVELVDTKTHVTFSFQARCGAAGEIAFAGDVYPGSWDVNVYGVEPVLPAAAFPAIQSLTVD